MIAGEARNMVHLAHGCAARSLPDDSLTTFTAFTYGNKKVILNNSYMR